MSATVAHVTPWGVHCGIAKHLSYWIPHQRRPGVICAERVPFWHTVTEDWNTFPSARCWSRSTRDALFNATARAREYNARIIHLQWDPSFFPFDALTEYARVAAAQNLRTVVTAHTLVDDGQFTWENKAVLRLADQIAVGTPGMVKAFTEYAAQFAIPLKRPVRWVPLAVPNVYARSALSDPAPAGESNGPLILTWGFLGGIKGHLEICEAVRLLRRYAPAARLMIAGRAMTGEQRENLQRLQALAASAPDMICVREGFLSDAEVYDLCRSASCVVLNHQVRHNSSSGTVALSVASGAPVVVSDSPMFGGYAEAHAVKVAEPGPDGLADAILDVLTDESQLDAGRAEMMKRAAAPAVAAEYESIYQELETA